LQIFQRQAGRVAIRGLECDVFCLRFQAGEVQEIGYPDPGPFGGEAPSFSRKREKAFGLSCGNAAGSARYRTEEIATAIWNRKLVNKTYRQWPGEEAPRTRKT